MASSEIIAAATQIQLLDRQNTVVHGTRTLGFYWESGKVVSKLLGGPSGRAQYGQNRILELAEELNARGNPRVLEIHPPQGETFC